MLAHPLSRKNPSFAENHKFNLQRSVVLFVTAIVLHYFPLLLLRLNCICSSNFVHHRLFARLISSYRRAEILAESVYSDDADAT
jgi:hypothetical protein